MRLGQVAAGYEHARGMDREHAAFVLKAKQRRTSDGGLHRLAVMVGVVPVSDGGMVLSCGDREVRARRVRENHTLHIDAELARLIIVLEHALPEEGQLVRKARGYVEIELPEAECRV